MKLIAFILLTLNLSWAHDHAEIKCAQNIEVVKVDDIENIMKHLKWNGADDNQIKNAQCKTKNVPSRQDIEALIKEKSKNTAKGSAHGVNFEGESTALIEAFRDLTTAKDGFGWRNESKNQKNIQKDYKINPACKKVMCAVEKIWGADMGAKLLYMYLKHGFNGSELAFENSDRFNQAELDNAIIGLDDLPAHLIPLGKNQRLTRFSRGYTLAMYGSGVVANAVVMLFDLYERENAQQKQYTIYHEMAHNISTKLGGMDNSSAWLKQSGWVKKGDDWAAGKNACFISEYGKTNPWEDYAESLSAYRYDPKGFEKACPTKYKFVKDEVYKGMEYKKEEQCSPIPSQKLSAIRDDLFNDIIKNTKIDIDLEKIQKSCANSFSYPATEQETQSCSEKIFANHNFDLNQSTVTEMLKKHGIKDTTYNRDLILQGIIANVKTSEKVKALAHSKSSEIKQQMELEIQKSISSSIPEKPSTHFGPPDQWDWVFKVRKCNAHMWGKMSVEMEKCMADVLVKEDENQQYWNKGYFPKFIPSPLLNAQGKDQVNAQRKDALKKWIVDSDISVPVVEFQKKKMAEDVNHHFSHVSSKIQYSTKRRDWRKLSPQEYCRTFYAKGSVFTNQWGLDENSTNDVLEMFCIDTQKDHKRRRVIKEKVYTDWIDQNLK
jgi:hypothetical protein